MEDALHRLLAAAVLFGPRVVASLLILAGFWIGALVVQAGVARVAAARRVHRDVATALGQGIKAGVLAFGIVTALGTSGFNVTGLVAGLGLTGFALGFALKDVLANVVAGAIILVYRPFQLDDHISVAGFEGAVADIDMRYTTLRVEDRRILVPNSTVLTSPVSIFSK
jgi:small conductance mechanosensitive channel